MRKALIFVCAFVVSSMVIYMFYYYSQQHKLTRGIVANAAELPKTLISPLKPKHFSDTSYIGNLGLLLAADPGENFDFTIPPPPNFIVLNRAFNNSLINDVNEDISNKFPSHPPIGFPNIKPGQKILFSYFFQNVILPEGFKLSAQSIDNKWYRSLRYTSDGSSNVKTFKRNGINAISIEVDKNTSLVISSAELPDSAYVIFETLDKNKIVEFPEIDFNIIKYWNPGEAAKFIANVNSYSLLEQRLKFKLSSPKNDGDILQKQKIADYNFKKPFYLYLFNNAGSKPYLMLYVSNNELLLPLHPKSR